MSREINLIGGFYKDNSLTFSAQDTVNWLPVPDESSGARSPIKLRGLPGLLSDSPVEISGAPLVVSDLFPAGQTGSNPFVTGSSGSFPTGITLDITAISFPASGSNSAVFGINCQRTRGNVQLFLNGDFLTSFDFENTSASNREFSVAFPISAGDVVRMVLFRTSTVGSVGTIDARVAYYSQTVSQLGMPGPLTTAYLGPIRGLRNVEGALFVVSGDLLIRFQSESEAEYLGTIPGVGRVSISHNQITGGNEVLIVNGTSGYVYNTVDQTLTQVTDEGYPGAIVADYVDSYLVQIEPFRRFWFHSNLANALDYNTLDRYEAEASPDRMVTLAVFFREVWVFSERTTEVYVNTGAATGTFQRATGSVIEKGCAGRFAVGKTDSGLFWLGDDGVIYRANGYTPERISTHAIESAIAPLDKSACYTMVWEDEGHSVIYFAFPSGPTFGYDAATGMWHRRESQGLKGWRVGHLERWQGRYIAGDIYGGGLFELDWDTYTEGGDPLICERTSGTFSDSQSELFYSGLELVMDTGSADGHKVQVAYSDDFGRNYTNWKERSLGNVGEYAKRVRFFRLGRARNRIWKIRVSSAGKRDLISASLTVEAGN